MISAHADAAIGDAEQLVSALATDVRQQDLSDEAAVREIHRRMRDLITGSPYLTSTWIVDAGGNNRVDSWTFPARQLPANNRNYFVRHTAGEEGPLILSDPRPGSVTGKQRFTYSVAVRNSDGTLRAVLVVGLLSGYFDALYAEAANWDTARAGLYSFDGGILASLGNEPRASPEFIIALEDRVREADSGSAIISAGKDVRIVGWKRSTRYPALYASASQTVSAALEAWRMRSVLFAIVTAFALLSILLFALVALRLARSQHIVQMTALANKEINHRVKNSLQLVAGLAEFRGSQANPEQKEMLSQLAAQIRTVADVHSILEHGASVQYVEACDLLTKLCDRTQRMTMHQIARDMSGEVMLPAGTATYVAVMANELLTNALKHARSKVSLSFRTEGPAIVIEIGDDGPGLPEGFSIKTSRRFGLGAVATIAESTNAILSWHRAPLGGALFRLVMPQLSS